MMEPSGAACMTIEPHLATCTTPSPSNHDTLFPACTLTLFVLRHTNSTLEVSIGPGCGWWLAQSGIDRIVQRARAHDQSQSYRTSRTGTIIVRANISIRNDARLKQSFIVVAIIFVPSVPICEIECMWEWLGLVWMPILAFHPALPTIPLG